jgi:hypothetical protein
MTQVSTGDIVRAPVSASYNDVPSSVHREAGMVYCRIINSTPDSDGDYKCVFLDASGNDAKTDYVNADSVEHVSRYPWTVDDSLEEKIENPDGDEDRLAVLNEEQENLVQMQEMQERTVAEGVLRLSVHTVTSAENSQQWAILVDHPVLGELKFFLEKPVAGWSDDYRIVGLLKSYDIFDGNPYKLQRREVYVQFTGSDPEKSSHWTILDGGADFTSSTTTVSTDSSENSPSLRERLWPF